MVAPESDEPERFVPLNLPGHSGPAASYDPVEEPPAEDPRAEFPGLANQSADPAVEEADGEQEAAPAEVAADGDPANRGLLVKFLSSVKN